MARLKPWRKDGPDPIEAMIPAWERETAPAMPYESIADHALRVNRLDGLTPAELAQLETDRPPNLNWGLRPDPMVARAFRSMCEVRAAWHAAAGRHELAAAWRARFEETEKSEHV
jgi:hypothetical protein